jgi:hypothetical protein
MTTTPAHFTPEQAEQAQKGLDEMVEAVRDLITIRAALASMGSSHTLSPVYTELLTLFAEQPEKAATIATFAVIRLAEQADA